MKSPLIFAAGVVAILFSDCSTVDSRIGRIRAEFSSWPPAVQEKVAAGKIDIVFTPEQVLIALGDPDWKFTRTTADGTSANWTYRERKPRVGFGLGIGGGAWHGSNVYAGGVM